MKHAERTTLNKGTKTLIFFYIRGRKCWVTKSRWKSRISSNRIRRCFDWVFTSNSMTRDIALLRTCSAISTGVSIAIIRNYRDKNRFISSNKIESSIKRKTDNQWLFLQNSNFLTVFSYYCNDMTWTLTFHLITALTWRYEDSFVDVKDKKFILSEFQYFNI